jgi:hypothetical protein
LAAAAAAATVMLRKVQQLQQAKRPRPSSPKQHCHVPSTGPTHHCRMHCSCWLCPARYILTGCFHNFIAVPAFSAV